ncbi:unnamed protein product, partial [Brenthis ino]
MRPARCSAATPTLHTNHGSVPRSAFEPTRVPYTPVSIRLTSQASFRTCVTSASYGAVSEEDRSTPSQQEPIPGDYEAEDAAKW